MDSKSFVMTGYVQRSTCNCGCATNNAFWLDGGFGGTYHLAKMHHGIEKYMDELSEAGPNENGKSVDVKVVITIEKLKEHDHRLMRRGSFGGGGPEINRELRKDILKPSHNEEVETLTGDAEFGPHKKFSKKLPVSYLQDLHDQLLLAKRTNNFSLVEEVMESFQRHINQEDDD